jgi:hypothetical protein
MPSISPPPRNEMGFVARIRRQTSAGFSPTFSGQERASDAIGVNPMRSHSRTISSYSSHMPVRTSCTPNTTTPRTRAYSTRNTMRGRAGRSSTSNPHDRYYLDPVRRVTLPSSRKYPTPSKAFDVYAFGTLVWEIYRNDPAIVFPTLDVSCFPNSIQKLISNCWNMSITFDTIIKTL